MLADGQGEVLGRGEVEGRNCIRYVVVEQQAGVGTLFFHRRHRQPNDMWRSDASLLDAILVLHEGFPPKKTQA